MNALVAFLAAPLLLGVINRVKALFAGRRGAPLLQPYYDLARLLRKGAVYSRTTTWVFRAGPLIGLAAAVVVVLMVPMGRAAVVSFPGDLLLVAYLMSLARFWTVLAALDTGSSFQGMGASREVTFAALGEPALLFGLTVLVLRTGSVSLTGMYATPPDLAWGQGTASLLLVVLAFFVLTLVENSRIPFDDPNTHLELTMVHEVMVLDHSGPDLAIIEYTSALKLWVLTALTVGLFVPSRPDHPWGDLGWELGGILAVGVAIGVVESVMGRLRLVAVPRIILGATGCSLVALILELWS